MVEADPPTADEPVADGTEPRRLTVARGIGVVALAAVLFTLLNPGTALTIGLAVLLLVIVPSRNAWRKVELIGALLWLIWALDAFSSVVVGFEILGLLALGGALGLSWIIRTWTEWRSRRGRSGMVGAALAQFGTPLCGLIGVAALATDADFRFRFALSEPAFRAEVRTATLTRTTYGTHGKRLGLGWVRGRKPVNSCVFFPMKQVFFDEFGVIYCPLPVPPPRPATRYWPIEGPWWRYAHYD